MVPLLARCPSSTQAPRSLPVQGLELVPLTLEVGDYVLSSELCVERKSIADLRGSLASGRLYHQAEAMSKHYRTPLLLIEFEGDKAFALQVGRWGYGLGMGRGGAGCWLAHTWCHLPCQVWHKACGNPPVHRW